MLMGHSPPSQQFPEHNGGVISAPFDTERVLYHLDNIREPLLP
jgi:hypothetical protein